MKKTLSIGLALGLALVGTPALATGGGHDPVTICHKGNTITVDGSALQAHLSHGDIEGACVTTVPETKTLEWFLPNGGTPDNVTWPQPIFTNQCGGWVQVDVYPYTTPEDKARTDALNDDGVLSNGEDHGHVISWSFKEAPACEEPEPTPEPTEEPSSPPVVVPEIPVPPVAVPASPSQVIPPETVTPPSSPASVPSPVESSTPSGAPSTAESPSTSTTPPVTASEELAVTGAKTNLAFLAVGLVSMGIWLKRRARRV